jgi:hypothetical protein
VRHRNPYLILGIPFGASRQQANMAYARKARALRRLGEEGRTRLTDLTWALNQVDEALVHPEAAMEVYRIPADPDAFDATGEGVLSPPPERLTPRGGDRSAAEEELVRAVARELLRELVRVRAGEVVLPPP